MHLRASLTALLLPANYGVRFTFLVRDGGVVMRSGLRYRGPFEIA